MIESLGNASGHPLSVVIIKMFFLNEDPAHFLTNILTNICLLVLINDKL